MSNKNDQDSAGSLLSRALIKAIHDAPKPLNNPPRTLLMLSGGLDSVALLANLLDATDHHVHAHYIELHNFEERGRAEADAIAQILPFCWEHYRDFDYSSSKCVFNVGWSGFDITLAMFFAARVHIALQDAFDYVVTGHRNPDTGLDQFTEAMAVYQACFVNQRVKPAWLVPLSGIDKRATYDSIPGELAAMSWSCRTPVAEDDGFRRCGQCHACKAIKEAVSS